MNRLTNLDRLYQVVTATHHPRRAGRTYAACCNAAGLLAVHENICIGWIIPLWVWIRHIKPILEQVLTEQGLSFEWKAEGVLVCNNNRLMFASAQVPVHSCGYDLGECEDFLAVVGQQATTRQATNLPQHLNIPPEAWEAWKAKKAEKA